MSLTTGLVSVAKRKGITQAREEPGERSDARKTCREFHE